MSLQKRLKPCLVVANGSVWGESSRRKVQRQRTLSCWTRPCPWCDAVCVIRGVESPVMGCSWLMSRPRWHMPDICRNISRATLNMTKERTGDQCSYWSAGLKERPITNWAVAFCTCCSGAMVDHGKPTKMEIYAVIKMVQDKHRHKLLHHTVVDVVFQLFQPVKLVETRMLTSSLTCGFSVSSLSSRGTRSRTTPEGCTTMDPT